MKNSQIEWTHHTFSPWRGCTKVSAGCTNCYAETMAKSNPAILGEWGPNGTRVIASESYWLQPISWNKEAEAAGKRRRVFCAPLCDVFEGPDTMPSEVWPQVSAARRRLYYLIEETSQLDWLLLTKRPEHVSTLIPTRWSQRLPDNVWIGTSVENQAAADERMPHLLNIPARVRFLSCEPLIGHVNLTKWILDVRTKCPISWIIVGGESGPCARPMHPEWVRALRNQATATGIAFLFKQWGEWISVPWPRPTSANKPAVALRPDGGSVYAQIGHAFGFRYPDEVCMERVGKKAAGRLLNGRLWDEYPGEDASLVRRGH